MCTDNMDPMAMISGGAYSTKPYAKTKHKKKMAPKKDPVYPPGYDSLLSLDPRRLVGVEDDFVDLRAKNTGSYTQAGKVTYMSPEEVPISLWDPTTIKTDAAIIAFGKRRSGKSHMIRELLYVHQGTFDRALVFTGTKHNGFYQRVPEECMPPSLRGGRLGFVPDKAVIHRYDEHILKRFLAFQESVHEFEDLWEEKGYRPEAVVVMDDCIGEQELSNSSHNGGVVDLFALGRHYRLMVIFMTQYPKAVGTILRDNVDYAIVFKQESDNAIEAITSTYMGELNPVTAKELIRSMTKGESDGPRSALIIDMDPFCPADQKYYTYTCASAEDLPDFEIGSEKFRKEMAFDKKGYLDRKRKVSQH